MKSNVSLILVRREVDLRLNQERPMWRLGRISALPTLAALIQSSLVDWEISSHSINLNKCHLTIFFPEKAMAAHSSTLAWKIPWTEEPSGLQSMGSLRVGHDWPTSLSLFTFMHWRRKWQPTPVFLPGESQGWGSLVGFRLWGHTESDTTEVT